MKSEAWNVYWSPTGQKIATVQATTAKAAKRKAPAPYRKYLGEIYAVKVSADTRPNPRKRGKKKVARRRRRTNPQAAAKRGRFQVAALRGHSILFLSGVALTSNREAASNYGSLSVTRKVANQVRKVGRPLGISKVAVVTAHDTAGEIRSFLLGEARRAAGKTR